MKLFGGGNHDWGGWDKDAQYPWYKLDFTNTENVRDIFFKKLERGIPFSFVRLGDGPLGYVDDLNHRWHPGDEGIKEGLIQTFLKLQSYDEEQFMLGVPFDTPEMSEGLVSPIKSLNQCWESMEKYFDLDRKYYAHNVPHWMFCCSENDAVKFTKLISSKKTCIVGNERFPQSVLEFLYGDVVHIKVPYLGAFYHHEKLTQEVLDRASDCEVILFAASFATYPMMANLYEHIGSKTTMIDIGSTIDPFVNFAHGVKAVSTPTTITHSGKRGWWVTDYPNMVQNFIDSKNNLES
jgi:hypothetical protein